MPSTAFESPPPSRNGSAYLGTKAVQNTNRCAEQTGTFFKDGITRVKGQLIRQKELSQRLQQIAHAENGDDEDIWAKAGRLEGQYLRFLRTPTRIGDFELLKRIGKGAFGEVCLVRGRRDGRVYALKSQLKTQARVPLLLPSLRARRDVLVTAESPWVVHLYLTFRDTKFLYLLMEFLPGGDLMTALIKHRILSEETTRFYMAQMTMAIEAVHRLGFVHGDIKPDNILLDRGGHIKLTDFGLSTGFGKDLNNEYYQQLGQGTGSTSERPGAREYLSLDQISLTVGNRSQVNEWRRTRRVMAYSAVGTPDYVAPEILLGMGYSYDIDWWSLGAIMYECLVGWAPYASEDSMITQRKIVNWPQFLWFPDDVYLSPDARHLIKSLMCWSVNRIGRGGASEIKAHPFFAGVEFSLLRSIKAPLEPQLASDTDTAYFPLEDIGQTADCRGIGDVTMGNTAARVDSLAEAAALIPDMMLPFGGYTFERFENNLHRE